MQTQTYGNYLEVTELGTNRLATHGRQTKLVLSLTAEARSDCQSWRTNGISAEFLADYVSLCFPSEQNINQSINSNTHSNTQRQMHDAVNYIVNELLENAIKYSYIPARCPVEVLLSVEETELCLYLTNCIDSAAAEHFRCYIQRLLAADAEALYLQQMEENAQRSGNGDGSGNGRGVSQLGYLSILSHYPANLAWKFAAKAEEPAIMTVTTLVRLRI